MKENEPKKIYGMIFAAGLGTRLVPFTHTKPKALVPVGGVPMLERVIKRFIEAGITDIVVNVHHFAEQITDFLKQNNNFGINIIISDESELLLDTGGGIVNASRFFNNADAVLIHNADILTDVELNDMVSHHFRKGADVTLLVSDRESSRVLYFDANSQMQGWKNIRTGATLPEGFDPDATEGLRPRAFGGVHVVSASALDALGRYTDKKVFSIIPFYSDSCRKMRIAGFEPESEYRWFDVGTPEKLAEAEKVYQSKNKD